MAPLIRSSSQAFQNSAQTVTVTTPTGCVTGDVLVAFVLTDNVGASIAASESWDGNPRNGDGGGSQMVAAVFYTNLVSSPGANYTFTTTAAAGNISAVLIAVNPNGDTFDTVASSLTQALTTTTSTTTAVTGVADPSVLLCAFGADDTGRTVSTPPATMTSAQNVVPNSSYLATYTEVNPGTGSLTRTAVWNSSTDTIAVALLLDFTTITGPTITVQPSAQTKVLTNANTATFSVTATGTGTVDLTAEIETSAGSGTFTTLANGSDATWTGLTATGSASASATTVGTFTAKTQTGKKIRFKADDDNGTSYSNEVLLTLYTGPVVTTFPATNGSGVSTATLTCDYVTGTGEAIEVAIVLPDGRLSVTTTTT